MTKPEAMKIVCVLFGSFPSARFTDQNFESYAEGLLDLDAATCGAAAQRLIRTSKFLPTIAEIREAATAQQHGPCPRGEEAWAALLQAKRAYGYDYGPDDVRRRRRRDPLFADERIRRCLTLWGGWNAFALADEDAPARARFIAMFDELAQRERRDVSSGIPLPRPQLGSGPAPKQITQQQAAKGAEGVRAPHDAGALPAPSVPEAPRVRVAPPRQKPGPTPFQRRVSVEELDAELARTAGGAP